MEYTFLYKRVEAILFIGVSLMRVNAEQAVDISTDKTMVTTVNDTWGYDWCFTIMSPSLSKGNKSRRTNIFFCFIYLLIFVLIVDTDGNQIIFNFSITFFYFNVTWPFRAWAIMALHKLITYVIRWFFLSLVFCKSCVFCLQQTLFICL